MKTLLIRPLLVAITLVVASHLALADEHDNHDNHRYVHHEEWRKGSKMRDEDWKRGEHVDYHAHHLRAPPRGYEWRLVDGNYVLAAVATGVIASVIAAAAAH